MAQVQKAAAGDTLLSSWMPAVTETIRAINAMQDLAGVLSLIARKACELLGLSQCAIYALESDGQTLRLAGSHGLTPAYVEELNAEPMRLGEGTARSGPPSVRAILTGNPVLVRAILDEPGVDRWKATIDREGISSIVAAPLRGAADRPLGTMTGFIALESNFDAERIPLLMLLSDHAAAALVAARQRDSEQAAISEMTAAISELRAHERTLARWQDLQQQLTRLLIQDVGLAGIAEFLARELSATITIDRADGTALARAPLDSSLRHYVDAVRENRALDEQVARILESGRSASLPWTGPAAVCLAPIPETGAARSRLWVARTSPDSFDDDELWAIEGCALLIALEQSRIERRADAEARLTKDLLADLLSPSAMVHSDSVLARAAALGHDPLGQHTLALFVAVGNLDGATSETIGYEEVTSRLSAAFQTTLSGRRPRPVIGAVGDSIVVLLPATRAEDAMRELVVQARKLSDGSVRCVVGGPLQSLSDLQPKLAVATRAAALVTVSSPEIVHLSDFGVYGLLLESGTGDSMVQFARTILGPVLDADRRRDSELLKTVRTWLRTNLSVGDTAKKLFVHPNTVRNRLKSVAKLTRLDLESPGDLASLSLALMVVEIRGETKGIGE